jgi:hypothetical protein
LDILNEQVNVVGRRDVVQHAQAISLPDLEEPVLPPQTVAFELELEIHKKQGHGTDVTMALH